MLSKGLSKKALGDAGEDRAVAYLLRAGLTLVTRNYRTPGRGGGEIDIVMRDTDGTLVFVEVRQRASQRHGGAASSVTATKRRRIVLAARHYLARLPTWPPCRFDVICIQGDANQPAAEGTVAWLRAAFDAS